MQASNQQQQQKQSAEKKQTAQTFDDSDAGGVALCPHCGAELDDGADFCGDCGKPVSEKATAQESVAQTTAAQTVRTVEAPAPAKPETAAIEETPVNVEPEPVVVEEEPVRKSFFSGRQMSSIRQTGADIDSEQRRRAEAARIAEEKRREAERIAEQKRLAQIAEEKRLAEERRREAERQAAQQAAEAQRIAAEQRQKAAAAQIAEDKRQAQIVEQRRQETAVQQAAQRAAEEAERQRQAREAQAQKEAVRQQSLAVPTGPSLIGTIWTCISSGQNLRKSFFIPADPADWEFKKCGVLFSHDWPESKNSWVQNGNSVTVKYNDNFATYELKIINPDLMQGTFKNTAGYEGPVELRRKK